jgi:hypothetical protein
MLWWLLACTGPDGEPAAREPSALPDDSAAPTESPVEVPLLADGLSCDIGVLPVREGDRMGRVTLTGASCNDGTPATIYVRPAPSPSDDWVWVFVGGGRCGDGESCADRWCGREYDASKMSSRWAPIRRDQGGILRDDPASPYATWNQVFLTYCSSDMWTGTRRDVELEANGERYRLHFEGAHVVDQALAVLWGGATSDDGLSRMPPLSEASNVLVAGLSAGGMGVITHLDDVAAALPEARVRGLVDAMFTPAPAAVDAALVDGIEQENERQWREESDGLFGSRVDASCAAAASVPWECIFPTGLLTSHVSTPYLLVHDLQDRPLAAPYLALGASIEAYGEGSRQSLLSLAAARPDVGVHGSLCRHHTRIGATDWFTQQAVYDGQQRWTVEDALAAWLDGQPVVVIDPGDGSASRCP